MISLYLSVPLSVISSSEIGSIGCHIVGLGKVVDFLSVEVGVKLNGKSHTNGDLDAGEHSGVLVGVVQLFGWEGGCAGASTGN